MPAAILADAEPVLALDRVAGEGSQRAAILASARDYHFLPPILRLLWRLLAALEKEARRVFPELTESGGFNHGASVTLPQQGQRWHEDVLRLEHRRVGRERCRR